MKKCLFLVAVVATTLAGPVLAFDDTDRAAVKTVFDRLIDGIKTNNYQDIFAVMPPAVLAKMAEPTGLDPAAFQAVAVEQMKAAMQQVQIKEVSYDLDGMQTATTSTDRDYALISTTTVLEMGGAAMKATGPALAFEDGGQWYVLQIQSPDQAALLEQVYPDLAGIELPAPQIAPLD